MKKAILILWNFLTGFWCDQQGQPSSKRIALYAALGMLYMIVNKSLGGGTVNDYVLYVVGIIILVCLGVITSEFFAKGNADLKK